MKLLSWNVNFGKPGDLTAKIKSEQPDIVTLQEVTLNLADDWAAHLKDICLEQHYCSGYDGQRKPYQCLIASASDWELTPDNIRWRSEAPYPELLGRAKVSVPDKGDIDVFTAHIPNGIGNGWKKIDTVHVLAAALRRARDSPRILTGDFNEPELFLRSRQIVTFGEIAHEEGGTSNHHWRDPLSASRAPIEWINGVLAVLGGEAQHGPRDAYRVWNGFGKPTPVTHCTTRGNPRCFDHTFVSRHFKVLKCDYYHEWRKQGLSDHSPMWAELCLQSDQPEWKQWSDECS